MHAIRTFCCQFRTRLGPAQELAALRPEIGAPGCQFRLRLGRRHLSRHAAPAGTAPTSASGLVARDCRQTLLNQFEPLIGLDGGDANMPIGIHGPDSVQVLAIELSGADDQAPRYGPAHPRMPKHLRQGTPTQR